MSRVRGDAVSDTRYVYICSAGHSGSTLLDLLLGSHSRIASLGEISHLPKNLALDTRCTCGAPVRQCAVWREVTRRLDAVLGTRIDVDPYSLHLGYPLAVDVVDRAHQTRGYLLRRKLVLALAWLRYRHDVALPKALLRGFEMGIDNNLVLYDTVRDVLGVDTVVDSSKSYLKAVALYRKRPQHARIILLSRDGRGIMFSHRKRRSSPLAGVHLWKRYYARALPLLHANVPEQAWLHVRYEDLAADPDAELQKICTGLSLAFEPAMLDFHAHQHHITNGNNMRFAAGATIAPDTQWQNGLSNRELWEFERLAGSLNRWLGHA
jgi:hypothetical protein